MTRFGAITLVTVAAATLLFYAVVHQVSSLWLDVALSPQVSAALQHSLDDQKLLRKLDPARTAAYRERFDSTRRLLAHIDVVRMNRAAVLHRFETVVVTVFACLATMLAAWSWIRYRQARERERADYLERLASWQETARRHAHEIKGPLTAARLEMERLTDLARRRAPGDELARAEQSVAEELARLAALTREFGSFGAIGPPVLRAESLREMAEEFCATFGRAWPNLELSLSAQAGEWPVCADRDLIRQVLVNLCTNAAHAVNGQGHAVLTIRRAGSRTTLDIADNGSGIAPALQPRVFDPYVTTRKIGSGMGLGLAISRKIMLDHGGDLELVETSPSGTTFRLTFGDSSCL